MSELKDQHHQVNYIELPAADLAAMKIFYGKVFGWTFQDWGETYVSFDGAGIAGGFDADSDRRPSVDGALVILYSNDLERSLAAVKAAGAKISVPPFSFPGGKRFHFIDPSHNDLAIWTQAE